MGVGVAVAVAVLGAALTAGWAAWGYAYGLDTDVASRSRGRLKRKITYGEENRI